VRFLIPKRRGDALGVGGTRMSVQAGVGLLILRPADD
jgi:hypothetical protein